MMGERAEHFFKKHSQMDDDRYAAQEGCGKHTIKAHSNNCYARATPYSAGSAMRRQRAGSVTNRVRLAESKLRPEGALSGGSSVLASAVAGSRGVVLPGALRSMTYTALVERSDRNRCCDGPLCTKPVIEVSSGDEATVDSKPERTSHHRTHTKCSEKGQRRQETDRRGREDGR